MSNHTSLTYSREEPPADDGLLPFLALPVPPGPDRLLEADDVAFLLGVPRTFVYALARRGVLPTVRIGERYVRFRAKAIEDWIAAQETTRPRGTR